MTRRKDGSYIGVSPIKACKDKEHCFAETDLGTFVTECKCGLVGYLKDDGQLNYHSDYRLASENQ